MQKKVIETELMHHKKISEARTESMIKNALNINFIFDVDNLGNSYNHLQHFFYYNIINARIRLFKK